MDLMDYRRKMIANSPHLKSASGAVVTFSDGADLPLNSLNVNIEPVQDLHGYDSPWVAGGGVNKLPPMVDGTYTGNGITAVVKNGVATLSGTSTASGNALTIPLAEEYTVTQGYLHLCNSVANASFAPSLESENISATSVSWSCSPVNRVGAIPSDKIGQTWTRVRVWISSGVTISGTYAPMVCADNTVRPYAPYENICPITGWNGVKVTRCGKNLLDDVTPTVVNAYISNLDGVPILCASAENRTVIVQIKENTTYTYTWNQSAIAGASADDSNIILFDEYPVVGVTLGYSTGGNMNNTNNKRTFNSAEYKYAAIKIANIYRSNYEETLSASMLELGSTATTYEPYNGVIIRSGGNLFNPHVYTGIAYNPTVGDTVTLTDSATQFTDNGNGVFTVTTSSTWRYFNVIIPIDSTKDYATKIAFSSTGQAGVTRGYLDADFKILTKFNSTDSAISWEYSLTPEANAAYYYFVITNRGTASATLTLTQPQFVEGATVGDYDPYTDTFYGGTLNPLTGVVTLDRQFFELDGNSNITVYSSGNASATEAYPYYAACYFSCHATENYSAWRFSHGRCVKAAYAGIFRTYVYTTAKVGFMLGADSALSTAAAVKTWLQTQKDNGTPLQIVVELTEPIIIQLTPHQIRSLYGNITIFADTGNTSLEYWAHP